MIGYLRHDDGDDLSECVMFSYATRVKERRDGGREGGREGEDGREKSEKKKKIKWVKRVHDLGLNK